MEFVGNQIKLKTVAITLAVAFLVGRISLFSGTFPAAIALISIMTAVSTVYIYLVPVVIIGMFSCGGLLVTLYGDMMATIFCGIFFLFFHKYRFSINQRMTAAVVALILCNGIYYGASHMLYLLSLEMLLKEALATIIYMRVFNTLAKMLFSKKRPLGISGAKMILAWEIFAVSMIGAIGLEKLVFPMLLLLIVLVCYCAGMQEGLSTGVAACIYWYYSGLGTFEEFFYIFAGLLAGHFISELFGTAYQKSVFGILIFFVMAPSAGEQLYGIAAAMAVFVAVPGGVLAAIHSFFEDRMGETANPLDLKLARICKGLRRKKEIFSSLSKLYGLGRSNRQIISYQFEGMARTVNQILQELSGGTLEEKKPAGKYPPVKVAHASYAFGTISGDSCLSFDFGKNKQAMMISDGMGKGSKAAEESSLVVTTMARLLEAGFDVDIAIKTINAGLMTGNTGETFATVDLAIIDKESLRGQIFKMGAASTFIKHGEKVLILKRPAPPIGLLSGLKLEYIDVHLKKGDLLIMVSDGVTDCDRADPDCVWLQQRLAEISSRDPQTVAELIVNKAAEKYGIRERDDLTVMVAAV